MSMRAADELRKSKLNSYFTVKAGRRSHKEASGFAVLWSDQKEKGACDGWIFARSAAPRLRADRSLRRPARSYRSLLAKSSHARPVLYQCVPTRPDLDRLANARTGLWRELFTRAFFLIGLLIRQSYKQCICHMRGVTDIISATNVQTDKHDQKFPF